MEYGESKLKEKGASAGLELVIEVYVGEAVLPFIIGFSVDVKDVLPALRFRADSPAINTDQLIKLYQTENLSTSLKEPGWFRLTPELSVRGTIQATLEVELKPKADSLAYSAAYRGLGRAGQYLARVAFSEAACVVVGVVAVAVLVVAHIALGQIVISREKKGGSEEAIGFAFVSGYAEMLAQLTDPEDSARGLGRLLDLDWVELFNNQAGLYLYYTTMGARETLVASEAARLEIQRCGRAAVAQDWMKFVKDNDGEKAWGVLRKHFNPRGASTAELKRTFLRLLDDQVSEHGKLRIEFPPAKKAAATSDEK